MEHIAAIVKRVMDQIKQQSTKGEAYASEDRPQG